MKKTLPVYAIFAVFVLTAAADTDTPLAGTASLTGIPAGDQLSITYGSYNSGAYNFYVSSLASLENDGDGTGQTSDDVSFGTFNLNGICSGNGSAPGQCQSLNNLTLDLNFVLPGASTVDIKTSVTAAEAFYNNEESVSITFSKLSSTSSDTSCLNNKCTVDFNTGPGGVSGSFVVSEDSDDSASLCLDDIGGYYCSNFGAGPKTGDVTSAPASFDITNVQITQNASVTPEPSAVLLFTTMAGLVGFTTRKKLFRK